jgi:hypothetical protein
MSAFGRKADINPDTRTMMVLRFTLCGRAAFVCVTQMSSFRGKADIGQTCRFYASGPIRLAQCLLGGVKQT